MFPYLLLVVLLFVLVYIYRVIVGVWRASNIYEDTGDRVKSQVALAWGVFWPILGLLWATVGLFRAVRSIVLGDEDDDVVLGVFSAPPPVPDGGQGEGDER